MLGASEARSMHLLSTDRLGLALAFSFVVAACASPTIPDDGNLPNDSAGAASVNKKPTATKKPSSSSSNAAPEGNPSDTTTSPPAKAPATTTTTPPATTPPSTSQCAGQTGDACFDCCNTASGGALAPADNVFGQCACGGGQCTAVCDANLCNGIGADATCSSCLQTTCAPAETAACTSTACKAGLQCLQQCN